MICKEEGFIFEAVECEVCVLPMGDDLDIEQSLRAGSVR
jgi:hypothetical protein